MTPRTATPATWRGHPTKLTDLLRDPPALHYAPPISSAAAQRTALRAARDLAVLFHLHGIDLAGARANQPAARARLRVVLSIINGG
ncbi:hypothetical protein U879_05730 [Defluviimonas sp. 20V17]|uniref:Uncharacterized protein n=1 Tax=Allgaiera indica TaxID=765699 RepID=A0AAN4UTX6_9RHOB|nr:hypothetical protein [Allgaiera indica]KDB04639.1 hypothetical protein U879_05730 [Defluviimonas sp. 20V17]GHE03734.1 hypothetical protein GCM10008024_28270 [Allgaiera indica]SDX73708.1 hypothetical protein SAMN05444006_12710 [Allgaiera indica]